MHTVSQWVQAAATKSSKHMIAPDKKVLKNSSSINSINVIAVHVSTCSMIVVYGSDAGTAFDISRVFN